MIKMITASTVEIDEPGIAVDEILSQLDIDNNMRENSIGLITCPPEFVDMGIVKAIDESLAFDTIGMTTLATATSEEEGLDVLSISVFTGDDVYITSGVSEPIYQHNYKHNLQDIYNQVKDDLDDQPKLMFAFGPLLSDTSGEKIIDQLHIDAGDIPVFGSIACNSSFNFDKSYVIYNGDEYERSAAIFMVSGNINPKFVVSTISDDKITKQKAIITDSDGSILKEVNDMNLVEYMKTIGLSEGDGIEGSASIPFVVDYGDGTKPPVRAIYQISEEGYAYCGGNMPIGSTLSIGTLDAEDIVKTAGEAMDEILKNDEINGIITFPCQARNYLLEMDYMAEMNIVKKKINNSVPFLLAYSGGEICPVYDESKKSINRYHNFTFISCII